MFIYVNMLHIMLYILTYIHTYILWSSRGIWRWGTEMAPHQEKEKKRGKSSALDLKWLKDRLCLVSAISLHPSLTPLSMLPILLEGNFLLNDWWNGKKGWPRWVLSICNHVGCPGKPRGVQSWLSLPWLLNSVTGRNRIKTQSPVNPKSFW